MSEEEYPEILQKTLTANEVVNILDDVATHATLHELRIKKANTEYSEIIDLQNLDTVAALVVNQQVHSLQIRYTFEEELWFDTIFFQEGQWSIVRMSWDGSQSDA